MLYQANSNLTSRPGVVLLVVMALLALFASVGLSFVFYADAEAVAARYMEQSLVKSEPEVDPEVDAVVAAAERAPADFERLETLRTV